MNRPFGWSFYPMKAKNITNNEAYKPVTISLTFETKEELDEFGRLCNFCPVVETIGKKCLPSYEFCQEIGANIEQEEILSDEKLMEHPYLKARYKRTSKL